MTDVNESGIGAISDTDSAADYVLENAANGTAVGLTAFADDPDGTDTVSYALDDDASGRFAIHATTGVVTVNAALDYETATSHAVTIRATSSDGSFSTQSFTIAVTDVNDHTPVAADDHYTVTQGASLVVAVPGLLANDLDADGDELTAALVNNVAHGSLVLHADGSFTYVSAPTFSGTDYFSYVVIDGEFRSETVTVTIVVEAVAPDDQGDDGTDPDPPPDEDSDEEDIPPDDVAPPPVHEGPPFVALSSGNDAGHIRTEATPPVLLHDDPPSREAGGESLSSLKPWLLDAVLRPVTALVMTDAATARTDGEVADERVERFVSGFPLTVAIAPSRDGPSGDTDVLSSEQLVLGTTTAAAMAFSVGYIIWLIRGGSLFACLLASLPAWSLFDPLPVLDCYATSGNDDDEECLQDIVT